MYTLQFYPEQETIGILEASLDGVVVYKESVNLEDTSSLDQFIANVQSLSSNTKKQESQTKIDSILATLSTILNT